MSKRSRSSDGTPTSTRTVRPGKFLSYKFNKLYPWSTHGAARIQRGTPQNIAQFGVDLKHANAAQKALRKKTGYTGRGGFWDVFQGVEQAADRFLTSGVPKVLNAAQGFKKLLGKGLYTGHGGYTSTDLVHGNNLMLSDHASSNSIPHFEGIGDETGSIVITHREYIGDIYGPSTAFNVQSYALNPGIQSTFPWLSQIACNYDEYEFVQMVWSWRSTTTDIGTSTNGQCGTVIMATNYNAASAPFTDKGAMLDYAHAHSCKTTEHMEHGVECDPAKSALTTTLYVRSNPVVSGQDLKTYDHGLFQIAVANSPSGFANNSLGELHVHYKVILRKPKLFVTRGLEIDQDQFATSSILASATATTTNIIGTVASPSTLFSNQQNNIGTLITPTATGLVITFPASYSGNLELYICISVLEILTSVFSINSISYGGNVVGIKETFNSFGQPVSGSSSNVLPIGAAVGSQYLYRQRVFVKSATGGTNNTITIGTTGGGNKVQTFINISQYNGYGLTTANDLPTWINSSNKTVVSLPF